MMRRASRLISGAGRWFHSQHRTPVLPQVRVKDPPSAQPVHVGYFLHRNQVVKHTPHPLEVEVSYLLEREHQRYSRHESSESSTHFMAARGQTLDLLNRTDPNAIKGNFFGLELYQDAMRVILQRYLPDKRVTPADLWDPEAQGVTPPQRHTLHRKLDDFLYLIVQEKESGRWTIPHATREPTESLRMTVDRALSAHHANGLDCFLWSNAPQATVPLADTGARLFIYSAAYLSGRPSFDKLQPAAQDHAWVTRRELRQYAADFESRELLEALLDIAADSTFDAA